MMSADFDLEGCIPIDYKADNTYLVSNSQHVTLADCKKKFQQKYYFRKKGEIVRFFPFDYGNLVHRVMEKTMMLPYSQRPIKMYEIGAEMGSKYPKKFRDKLAKALPSMEQRLDRYDAIDPEKSAEQLTAFRAPKHWFNPKLYEALQARKIKVDGEPISFDHFGYRGIIDYYGYETRSNDAVSLDWKSGKYKEKYIDKYSRQVNSYGFSGVVNGLIPKKLIIEFVEVETNMSDHRVLYDYNFEESKRLVRDTLQTVANNIIKSWVGAKFGKPLITEEQDDPCGVCEFAPHCRLNHNDIMNHYYQSASLKVWK